MTSWRMMRRTVLAGVLSVVSAGAVVLAQRGGPPATPQPEPLRFRYMGPPSAGRIAAVAGVAGDTTTYYAGAASGGVWKSVDSGKTFAPIFDEQPVQAIGALAVAPSDPKIVWAGTGEAWAIRDSDMMGDGVYKSMDAGASWQHMGLPETGRIGRILIHPTNPDIVYVCALGRTTGPQQERGVFKTTDGGKTWQRSLFANPNTGCSGLSMDRRDPNTLVAGMWQVEMHTYAEIERRARQRRLPDARRRHDLEEARERAAEVAGRQDRRRHRAVEFEPDLRAHPDAEPGLALALRRRGRNVEGRELGSHAHRPRGLLHPHRGESGQPGRSPHRQQQLPPLDRRRPHVSRAGFRRLRRLPRHLDGPEEPRPLGADRRQRHGHHDQPRAHLHERDAADRPDVSRRARPPGAVLDLQQPAGRRHDARAERSAGAGAQRALLRRHHRRRVGNRRAVAGALPLRRRRQARAATCGRQALAAASRASRCRPIRITPTSSGRAATRTR